MKRIVVCCDGKASLEIPPLEPKPFALDLTIFVLMHTH